MRGRLRKIPARRGSRPKTIGPADGFRRMGGLWQGRPRAQAARRTLGVRRRRGRPMPLTLHRGASCSPNSRGRLRSRPPACWRAQRGGRVDHEVKALPASARSTRPNASRPSAPTCGGTSRPASDLLGAAGEQEDLRPIFASTSQAWFRGRWAATRTAEEQRRSPWAGTSLGSEERAKILLLACCSQEAMAGSCCACSAWRCAATRRKPPAPAGRAPLDLHRPKPSAKQ